MQPPDVAGSRSMRTNPHKIADVATASRVAVLHAAAYDGSPVFRPLTRPQRPVGVIHEVQIR